MTVTNGYGATPGRDIFVRALKRAAGSVADGVRRWGDHRYAMAALRSLDDRALRDIGVHRYSIPRVAGGNLR